MRALALFGFLVAASAGAQAPAQIEKSVVVSAPVASVWEAWSTSRGLESWLCPKATVELKLNGRYEIEFDTKPPVGVRGSEGCQVLSFIPERMLSFTWNAPPTQPTMRLRRTFVVVQFTPTADGKTKIDLTHGGWKPGKEWEETRAYFDRAWGAVLGACQERFTKKVDPGPASPPNPAPEPDDAMKLMARLIGGTWRGEVKDPQGKPMVVEFKYRRHKDGVGIVGEGWIGKGRKDVVHVTNQFGIDPVTKSTYYLDCHNSGTVYWGHVAADKDALIFVFGPVGGDMNSFSSGSRLLDKDTMQNFIRNSKGEEIVGFSLKRVK